MKKIIFIICLTTFIFYSLTSEENKYRKNDQLINTMYVNSLEGLKVRDYPSLSAKKISGLVNALPVKIIEIGPEAEIDGMKDNWIKILIPAYEWKSNDPEYGWVFGGYLSESKIEYNFDSLIDINNFLTTKVWKIKNGSFTKKFMHNGEYIAEKLAAGGGESGYYQVISKDTIRISTRFYDEYGTSKLKVYNMKYKILSENEILLNDNLYLPYLDPITYNGLQSLKDFVYGNYNNESLYTFIFKENPYSHKYSNDEILKVINELIMYGVDTAGSPYLELYKEYWNTIIK